MRNGSLKPGSSISLPCHQASDCICLPAIISTSFLIEIFGNYNADALDFEK